MEKFFKLKENGTNVSTEIMAGITTFMTMAYILAVNPNILSASGMDRGAVFTATALSAFIATCLMALLSNYPFVLAPGMGLNAYFAYTVVLGMGYTWQAALAAVFVEGIIFIVLSLTNVREAIFNAIPMNLKHAVSVGIGLFIAFIGLQNAKIVVNNDSTLLGLFSFKGSVQAGTFNYEGITVLLALIGILITAIFLIKNVKGGILWGILITWGLGIICQFTGLYVPNADAGFYSLLPDFSSGFSIPALTPTLMKMDFSIVFSLDFVVIMFAFLFVDMFDTLVKSRFVEMFGDIITGKYNYKIRKLGDVAFIGSSHRVFTTEFVESGIPFYRGTEIGELANGIEPSEPYYISEEHYNKLTKNNTKPRIGDLLMPSICNKGQIWMVDTDRPFYYKDGRVLCISPNRDIFNSKYLEYFMRIKTLVEYPKLGSGSTFAEFKIFLLKDMDVLVPPRNVQNQFADFVASVDKSK